MRETNSLPRHIAVIMDGNGRWAKKRGLPRTEGHKQGAEVFRRICRYASDLGIEYLSFYAFSTENWKRSAQEVDAIMDLLRHYLAEMEEREDENKEGGYRIRFLGAREGMPQDIVRLMDEVEERSADKTRMFVNLCVNYGGRDEIVRAARTLAERVQAGTLQPQDITERLLSDALYTAGQPDPDLVIRPSGEFRLSNFLIWQSAYAEFWYDDVLWPDFTPADLDRAIEAYQNRDRRFGNAK
ncbi:MAG: isoprenyl transferase [Clostridia bacterium]|jgi:undecaprenyl diphosphate synthase|nr:isoprenyl transferase [Clostridia bacterium]